MAYKTSLREIPLNMIWSVGVNKSCLMAAVAIAWKTMNLVINVAICTMYIYMSPAKLKTAWLQMIKLRLKPGNIAMANFAICGKAKGYMRRIGGVVEIMLMTSNAIAGYSRETIRMAAITIDFGMRSMQRESGRMLVSRAFPTRGYR
jgi:hypothetical protein